MLLLSGINVTNSFPTNFCNLFNYFSLTLNINLKNKKMGKTDTEQEERVLSPRKEFEIIIKGHAEYDDDRSSPIDFDSAVNVYFKIHRDHLTKMFNTLGDIKYKSVLRNFQFDSVEKQIR